MKQSLAQRADSQSQEVVIMQAGGHKGKGGLEVAPLGRAELGADAEIDGPKPAAASPGDRRHRGPTGIACPPGAFLSCRFRQWCPVPC